MLRKAVLIATLATGAVSHAQDLLPLAVVDANGNVLGRYATDASYGEFVVYSSPYGLASIGLVQDDDNVQHWSLLDLQFDNIFFHSTDCTGPGYFATNVVGSSGRLPSFLMHVGTHQYLWVADSGAKVVVNAGQVRSTYNNGACSLFTLQRGAASAFVGSKPPIDLATMFTPPFTMR
jgi:hypothetical protein